MTRSRMEAKKVRRTRHHPASGWPSSRAASSLTLRAAVTRPGAPGRLALFAVAENLLTADAARPGTPRSRRSEEERSATCRPAATTLRRRHRRRRRKSTARWSSQATTRYISDASASPTTPAASSMVVFRPGRTTLKRPRSQLMQTTHPVADDTGPRNTPMMMITVSAGNRGDRHEHCRD